MINSEISKNADYTVGRLVYIEDTGSLGLLTRHYSVKKLCESDHLEVMFNETWIPAYIECLCNEYCLMCIYEERCYEVPLTDIKIRVAAYSENEELPF